MILFMQNGETCLDIHGHSALPQQWFNANHGLIQQAYCPILYISYYLPFKYNKMK